MGYNPKPSASEIQECLDALARNDNNSTAAARSLKMPRSTFCDRVKLAQDDDNIPTSTTAGEEFESTDSDGNKRVTAKGTAEVWNAELQERKVAEIVERAGIDLDTMRLGKVIAKAWQTPLNIDNQAIQLWNWYISVEAVPRAPKPLLDGLAELHSIKWPKLPKFPRFKPPKDEPRLGVMAPVDAHFGKLAWAEECGKSNDLKITRQLFTDATRSLLADLCRYNIERFLFVIGNDACHVDTLTNTTTKGTPQDADGRYPKIFRATFEAFCELTDAMLPIAPVDVVLVRGNHDLLASWHLAHAMQQRYASCNRVTVDEQFRDRKYYPYHKVLLGLTHGDGAKLNDLPTLMATEAPQQCGEALCREWITGHRHAKNTIGTKSVSSKHGFVMRTLSSLSGTDAWHYSKGYVGSQACEAYMYRRTSYAGHFNVDAQDFN